jgi:uncharacterized damage-inducible protein DinB
MYTSDSLLDFQTRAHRSLKKMVDHCRQFTDEQINRKLDGFGEPTIRLQLYHTIGAQKYWIGVIEGRMDADDDDPNYPTIESLEHYRRQVFELTETYLQNASVNELNTARPMTTWGGKERILVPALVFFRTQTHIYHHFGQIAAMCRLLDKPIPPGMDFPLD